MRYFVVGRTTTGRPYVVGEVVREFFDDGTYRSTSFAASFAPDESHVMLEDELLRNPEWARALTAWRARDDAVFNRETEELLLLVEAEEEAANRRSKLRLVSEEQMSHGPRSKPADLVVVRGARENELLARAKETIERARVVVAELRQVQEARRQFIESAKRRAGRDG